MELISPILDFALFVLLILQGLEIKKLRLKLGLINKNLGVLNDWKTEQLKLNQSVGEFNTKIARTLSTSQTEIFKQQSDQGISLRELEGELKYLKETQTEISTKFRHALEKEKPLVLSNQTCSLCRSFLPEGTVKTHDGKWICGNCREQRFAKELHSLTH